MCRRLTHGSDKHLDIPSYVLNIGTCYHEMDKYEEAIEYYQKALQLEQAMGMDGSEKTCTTLKNIAMSYYELDRYVALSLIMWTEVSSFPRVILHHHISI